jgi:putative DNA primase/helicase
MSRELIEQARGVRIEDEVARRGIMLRGHGIDRCGACPVCGGHDRFAINARKQVFICRRCRAFGDVITMVQHLDGCDFAEAVKTLTGDELRRTVSPAASKKTDDYEREQHRKAAWLWSQRKPIAGTIAEKYLRGRKITCALPATLGFLPSRKLEHHPALIATFGLVDEPEPGIVGMPRDVGSVHLTLLRRDGSGKVDVEPNKIIIGSPGSLPIALAAPNDLLGLCIAEGIEDGLTAHQATGLVAWAAGSAGQMPKLAGVIPSYIECVTILAHDDQAGQDGAHKLAEALYRRGIEVIVEGLS